MSDLYVVEASGGGYLLPDHYPTADILKAGTWPKEMAESLASEKSKRHAVPIGKAWAQWAHHHAPADPAELQPAERPDISDQPQVIITCMIPENIHAATARFLETFTPHQQRIVEKSNLLQRALVETGQDPLDDEQAMAHVITDDIDEIAVALLQLQGRVSFEQVIGMMRETWAGLCAAQAISAITDGSDEDEPV